LLHEFAVLLHFIFPLCRRLLRCRGGSALSGQSEGVEANHRIHVLQGVSLARKRTSGGLDGAEDALDFFGSHDSANVGVGADGGRRVESGFFGGSSLGGTKDGVEGLEGAFGPDDETTNVTTRGELEEVQSVYVASINTLDVAEGSDERIVSASFLVVDEERSSALNITSASGFTLTSTEAVGVLHSLQVSIEAEERKEGNGILGLGDGVNVGISNNERDFCEGIDAVSAGLNERCKGRSRKCGTGGKSALTFADLNVPSSPNFGRCEHASSSAHVTESSLSGSVSTTSRYTRDTGHGTTGSPTLCRSLFSSFFGNGIWLSVILVHSGVNADY